MQRKLFVCGVWMLLAGVSPFVSAQETKPADTKPVATAAVEGDLQVGTKKFKLGHIVAYETKLGDETRINVLMSDRRIPVKEVKTALDENEGMDTSLSLDQPYLKITFEKSGKVNEYKIGAAGTGINAGGESLESTLALDGERVKGEVKLPLEGEGALQRAFTVKVDVALGLDNAPKPVRPAGPVKATVTGTFKGNGKPAKLMFVTAVEDEPFADKPSIKLIFSENDHTKDPKADFNVGFGKYGSSLIISVHENGSIFGCQVSHMAHEMRGFSSVGSIGTSEFDVGDGQISGRITTDGEQDTFGNKWEVDIKFAAPYTPTKKPTVVAENPMPKKEKEKKSKKPKKPVTEATEDEPKEDKPEEPAGDKLSIYDLALPKDASDHQYKKLVEMFEFQSKLDSLSMVKELTKSLEGQGWETDGSDLVTAKSSILKRKRGEAELTIFVKPAGKGSKVNMHTQGLEWTKKADKKSEKEEDKDE